MSKVIRILLVDDLTLVRKGIRALLQSASGIRVIGEASNAPEALRLAAKLQPDVIVSDLLLAEGGGFALLRKLMARAAPIPVVILAAFSDEGFAAEAWRLGATGYVRKSGKPAELLHAVRAAAKGVRCFRVAVNETAPAPAVAAADLFHTLSLRERQVLHLSGLGKTSRFIAGQLGISPRTVESHRATVMKKMQLRGLGELIRYAADHCKSPTVDYQVPAPDQLLRKQG